MPKNESSPLTQESNRTSLRNVDRPSKKPIKTDKFSDEIERKLLEKEKMSMYIENIDIYMRKIYKIANKIAEVSTIGREMQNDAHSKWQIKGYVYEEKTNKPIEGFTVKAFIVSKLKENEYIGNARTDFQGRFIIQYRKTDFVVNFLESLSEGGPDIILSIYNHEGKLVETTPKRSGASRFEEYEILLPITSITTIPSIKIDDVLAAANIIDKVTVGKLFNETGVIDSIGLLSLAGNLKPDKVGLDEPSLQRVFRVAKFHLASGSISLAGKLTGLSQVRTLCELGSVPRVRIEKMLGKLGDEELIALDRLSATALSIRNNVVNYSAARQREKSRDGQWYPGVQKTDEGAKGKEPPPCKDCDPWENVFSPRAYLFDLLDLIYFHWDVTTSTLEKVLFQEIDKLGSEEANETLPQVEIAVEVLENYLKATDFALPIGDYELANACVAEWIYLLDVTEEQLQKAVDAADANVVELAKVILATKFDLSVLQSIRELLTWSPDSGPDPGIASFSAAYGKADAAFLTALASTYARVLVLYRDALIENSHEQQVLPLQEKLFVDLQAQPCGETNRITQLIISLQAFILAVRTGDIADVSRKDLSDDLIDFKELSKIPVEDAYWRWLKDFETWASAMYTLLYPENVLMPPLFDEGYSDAFKEAQQTLSGKVDMKAAYGVFCNYLFSWSMPVPLQDLLEREEQSEGENDEDDAGTSLLEKKIIKRRAKFAARMKRNLNHRTLDKLVEQAVQTIWDGMWWIDQFPELSEYCSDYLQHVDSHGSYTSAKCFPWEDPSQKRLQELNLHFPLLVAWALNHSGEYAAANDWYRRLYDPMRPKGQRFIFPFGEHFSGNVVRGERWFDDMVDPQQIAERREGVYLRYSILAMVKNLLSWADHEYALGRPESIDRARRLYELAQRVLSAPDLADHCGQTIRELELDIVTDIRPEIQAVFPDLKIEVNRLRGIMDPGLLSAAIKDFRELISDLQEPRDIDPIRETVSKALRADRELRPTTALGVQLDQAHLMLTQCEDQLIFTNVTLPSSRKAEVSTALSLLGTQMIPDRPGFIIPGGPIGSSVTFCVPANPLLKQLNFYTEQSLLKLRSCLSIDAEPLPSASLPTTASDVIDTLAGEAAHRPNQNGLDLTWNLPRYRYAYLIEKARQYVDVAQRLGSMLLMAYEKREEECLRQLTATQTLELAKATVTLKDLAVDDAETANLVAVAQQNRAEYQRNFWQNRIQEGMLSAGEITGLGMMATSGAFQLLAAATNIISAGPAALVAAAGAATTAAGIAAEAPTMGASSVAVMTGSLVTSAALAAGGSALAAALGNTGGALSTFGQVTLNLASFERRWEEWNLSLGTSNLDLGISKLQVTQAKNRIAIADQDKKIGELQQAHAEQTLNFLKNKFSNDKLYIWMIDVLEQCYKSLMQIATAVARQAQSALEFERQKTVEIITGDYWSIEAAGAPTTGMTEEQRQSGLLGAERLLTDLTKLDAFKLATDRRQLQLSKTISMAQTIPRELVELRTEGTSTFNTLLDWFDLDFPGHYLRLIKSVRVSILCLAPPVDGIHAMLHNGGESSVVVRDLSGAFTKKRSMRVFAESIALDAAYNESGLFVLDYNDPMFLPFEGLGVETQWTLDLPRATNRFNFNTIVDVMLTIDYTAYHNVKYASDVRERFKEMIVKPDVMMDMRVQYPDEWYHFKNPTPGSTITERAIAVNMETAALPPNFRATDPAIQVHHITLLVLGDFTDKVDENVFSAIKVTKNGTTFSGVTVVAGGEQTFETRIIGDGRHYAVLSTRPPGSNPVDDDGITSTIAPEGAWKVVLSDTQIADLVENIIVVITVKGKINWT